MKVIIISITIMITIHKNNLHPTQVEHQLRTYTVYNGRPSGFKTETQLLPSLVHLIYLPQE